MSRTLHQALDDAARDELGPLDLLALAAGARATHHRRVDKQKAAGVALVALVVLLTTLVPGWTVLRHVAVPATGSGAGAGGGVHGYPVRIGWQWPVLDLPAKPGPLAAVLSGAGAVGNDWWAVRADGHRWRLHLSVYAGDRPALSLDGTRLAYLAADSNTLVVGHLDTGRTIQLRRIGVDSTPPVAAGITIGVQGQSPKFWSPDGRFLLTLGGSVGGTARGAVVIDTTTGAARLVGRDVLPAGWLPDGRTLVTFSATSVQDPNPNPEIVTGITRYTGATVRIVNLTGHIKRVVRVTPREAWPVESTLPGQWTPSVSPDGRQLLMKIDTRSGALLQRFSVADGHQIGRSVPLVNAYDVCSSSWVDGHTVSVVTTTGSLDTARLSINLRSGASRTTTVVDPHLGSRCIELAQHAAAGRAYGGGLWGTSTSWLSWRWRQWIVMPLLALLALRGLILLLKRWRSTRQSRSPGSTSAATSSNTSGSPA